MADRRTIPFEYEHLQFIEPQASQVEGRRATLDMFGRAERLGRSFTVMRGDTILMVAGVMDRSPGVGLAWSIISRHADCYDVLGACKQLHELYDSLAGDDRYERIEFEIDNAFTKGHRLAVLLGFKLKRVITGVGPNGEDIAMYVRT